jgi:hypothetical protein
MKPISRRAHINKLAPDASSGHTRDARARAWVFVFQCYAKKKAASPGGPDDAEEPQNDRTAEPEYSR